MLLHGGESLQRSAYGVLDASGTSGGRGRPGVLYLTSQRVVFEASVSRGAVRDLIGGADSQLAVNAPLVDVLNASIRKGRLGRPRLVLEISGGHRVAFDVLEPDDWAAAIALAKRALPSPLGPAAPTVTVEREVVKIRCRYCGALVREVHATCPSCGAPL